ncbi:MAG: DNA alkylation repair protein [Muribaculaceae bacterium]|nr:DNA alkylation repair protein [Muribaculaceae bacterium]
MTTFNAMQAVKRQFFALRNGVIADHIRRSDNSYKIIFGLNLPQLNEIAASTGYDEQLADALWDNRSTRESMMLAPMLIDPKRMSREKAEMWITQVPNREVADILCHKLLRHTPYALELAKQMCDNDNSLVRYTVIRLLFNLLPASATVAKEMCAREVKGGDPVTTSIARQLLEELEFIGS